MPCIGNKLLLLFRAAHNGFDGLSGKEHNQSIYQRYTDCHCSKGADGYIFYGTKLLIAVKKYCHIAVLIMLYDAIFIAGIISVSFTMRQRH